VIAESLRFWADCLLTVVVPRLTQPSITPGSVNEDQLLPGKAKAGMVDKRVDVQVKL